MLERTKHDEQMISLGTEPANPIFLAWTRRCPPLGITAIFVPINKKGSRGCPDEPRIMLAYERSG
jgi:hypothetical protein